MTLYEKFKKLDIDFSRLGLEQRDTRSDYFCTPKGAEVIGWAGVDGIHCGFVKGFGEMVFTVSPMNTRGNYVKPVANTFEDFLRLLLTCGGVDAVEQAWMWNRGEFDAFLETYPPDDEQRTVLNALRDKLSLTPMDDPYGYIKGVQSSFDYGRLCFSEEYYELVSDEPEPQEPPEIPEWKVYFGNGFGYHRGHDRPGKEIAVNKIFTWGGRTWHIPSVYSCGKGLAVDFYVEVAPNVYRAFMEKWRPWWEKDKPLTPEEEEQQMAENPMQVHFTPKATVNGRELRFSSGIASNWIPKSLRLEYNHRAYSQNLESIWIAEHYGLDSELGWMFCRYFFPWATKTKPMMKTLSLLLEQDRTPISGPRFTVSGVGDTVLFTHPVTGECHTLQVVEYENQRVKFSHLEDDLEYPDYYIAMSYEVEPELPKESLAVLDCGKGDSPRKKASIGGADGPMSFFVGIVVDTDDNGKTNPRSAYSALRFEPPEHIEWRIEFYQKTVEDIEIDLPLS